MNETQNPAESADAAQDTDGIPAQILAVVGADPRKAAKFEKRMAAVDIREQALESLGVTPAAIAKLRQRIAQSD